MYNLFHHYSCNHACINELGVPLSIVCVLSSNVQFSARYVRREKEIAETRRELAEGENLRHKQLLESVRRQLVSTQAEMKELCENASSQTLTATQHAEILKKVSVQWLCCGDKISVGHRLSESCNILATPWYRTKEMA